MTAPARKRRKAVADRCDKCRQIVSVRSTPNYALRACRCGTWVKATGSRNVYVSFTITEDTCDAR